jgi:hypothetical protein
LDRGDSVFGGESSHEQCQLTVGRHLDGSFINALNVSWGAASATVHFHDKLGILHGLLSLEIRWAD